MDAAQAVAGSDVRDPNDFDADSFHSTEEDNQVPDEASERYCGSKEFLEHGEVAEDDVLAPDKAPVEAPDVAANHELATGDGEFPEQGECGELVGSFEGQTGDVAEAEVLCRFCYGSEAEDLISPCRCRGTQKYIHRGCLDEWRSKKGWRAITHCSTCGAPFHLRLPLRTPTCVVLAGAVRILSAALLFSVVQLIPFGLGHLASKDSFHRSLRGICEDGKYLLCYCLGVWELLADLAFAPGLGMERWYWRWSFCGAVALLKHLVVHPAVDILLQSCQPDLEPDSLAPAVSLFLSHSPRPYTNNTATFLEHMEALAAAPSPRPRCGLLARAASVLGVLCTLAVGLTISIYVVVQLLAGMGPVSRVSRETLVKELEVIDVPGDYSVPDWTPREQRTLRALSVLT